MNDDPYVSPEELQAANARCDAELARLGMSPSHNKEFPVRIRSAWKQDGLLRRGTLTDKKIAKYIEAGWYDADFKQARLDKARKRQQKRDGNFVQENGRTIFRPL